VDPTNYGIVKMKWHSSVRFPRGGFAGRSLKSTAWLDVRQTGAGECTITIVASAIGNAVFDATGAHLRRFISSIGPPPHHVGAGRLRGFKT
jgi:hypothetical protein